MLFLELQNKAQIDAAPPLETKSMIGITSGQLRDSRWQNQKKFDMQQEEMTALGNILEAAQEDGAAHKIAIQHFQDKAYQDQQVSDALQQTIRSLQSDLTTLQESLRFQGTTLREEMQLQISEHSREFQALQSQNVSLSAVPTSMDVSAAELNAAIAGSISYPVLVLLGHIESNGFSAYSGASFEPVLTVKKVGEGFTLPDVSDARFVEGYLRITLTPQTDEGESEVYAEGNSFALDVQVAVDDQWLGVLVEKKVITFNVIA